MSVGIVMLVHTALERAEQAARHWAAGGCPVVIHVDKSVNRARYNQFCAALADVPYISSQSVIAANGGRGSWLLDRKVQQSICCRNFHSCVMYS